MCQSRKTVRPRPLPAPARDLCTHLEERGLASLSHGEGLLDDLRTPSRPRVPSRALLCVATFEEVLRALPRAVVSGPDGTRLTQATACGPIDLIPTGGAPAEATLLRFGLGPYAFAFRPHDASWIDPQERLAPFLDGSLDLAHPHPSSSSPFIEAPRRYWIAARLLAEYDLRPTDALLESARTAFPQASSQLPAGSPARREITRILSAPDPARALDFLRESGVIDALVTGTSPNHAERIAHLPPLLSLRWAAWLRGGAIASAMVRFRVPHALARRIERLHATHPIDRAVSPAREAGLRKIEGRLSAEEIDALFLWRRLELAELPDREKAGRIESRLDEIRRRLDARQEAQRRAGVVRALALDGRAVMERLGAGPGPHVGRALAHLARFVADRPEANSAPTLERELVIWARTQTNLLDETSRSAED